MDDSKTLSEMFEDIKEEMCEHYCRFPNEYGACGPDDDPDAKQDEMYEQICSGCPLMRL